MDALMDMDDCLESAEMGMASSKLCSKASAPIPSHAEREKMISASYVKYAVGSTAITIKKQCARQGIRGGKRSRPAGEEE